MRVRAFGAPEYPSSTLMRRAWRCQGDLLVTSRRRPATASRPGSDVRMRPSTPADRLCVVARAGDGGTASADLRARLAPLMRAALRSGRPRWRGSSRSPATPRRAATRVPGCAGPARRRRPWSCSSPTAASPCPPTSSRCSPSRCGELPYVNVHRFLIRARRRRARALPATRSDGGVLLLEDIGDTDAVGRRAGQARRGGRRSSSRAPSTSCCSSQIDGTRAATTPASPFSSRSTSASSCGSSSTSSSAGWSIASTRPLPDAEAALLREHFAALARYLDREPRVLNHRDFHGWNLFVQRRTHPRHRLPGRPAGAGALRPRHPARRPRHPGGHATRHSSARLLAYYARRRKRAAEPRWDRGELWEVYSACALQKAFKVVGRFHYLDRVKGKPGYLRYLPPTLRADRAPARARPDSARAARRSRPATSPSCDREGDDPRRRASAAACARSPTACPSR